MIPRVRMKDGPQADPVSYDASGVVEMTYLVAP